MDYISTIFVKTCPNFLGWGCMFWPIFFPAIITIVTMIIWWLVAGAKFKADNTKKDYSLILLIGSIIVIAAVGLVIYWQNKIP